MRERIGEGDHSPEKPAKHELVGCQYCGRELRKSDTTRCICDSDDDTTEPCSVCGISDEEDEGDDPNWWRNEVQREEGMLGGIDSYNDWGGA